MWKKPKAQTPLQKLKKKQTKKLVPLSTLIKRADIWFSRYVRLRDSEWKYGHWIGECITCQKKMVVCDSYGRWSAGVNLGHYIGRANKRLRWDEFNCNLQCARCNAWRDKSDMLKAYERGLDLKYGRGTATELQIQSREMHRPTREELEETIRVSKEYVEFTLRHPEGIAA